jgi:hypothetical protein
MALRSGHGNGAGIPRIEVLPPCELPLGVPSPAQQRSPTDFDARGKFAPGNALSRRGGKARAGKTRLAERMGLRPLPSGSDFGRYKAAAVGFRRAQTSALAASVGGGHCGPAPSSLVASAALQLAWSRYFSDKAAEVGDPELALTASRLGDASRQNLLAAHELCAKEALARKAAAPSDPARALVASLALTPVKGPAAPAKVDS